MPQGDGRRLEVEGIALAADDRDPSLEVSEQPGGPCAGRDHDAICRPLFVLADHRCQGTAAAGPSAGLDAHDARARQQLPATAANPLSQGDGQRPRIDVTFRWQDECPTDVVGKCRLEILGPARHRLTDAEPAEPARFGDLVVGVLRVPVRHDEARPMLVERQSVGPQLVVERHRPPVQLRHRLEAGAIGSALQCARNSRSQRRNPGSSRGRA